MIGARIGYFVCKEVQETETIGTFRVVMQDRNSLRLYSEEVDVPRYPDPARRLAIYRRATYTTGLCDVALAFAMAHAANESIVEMLAGYPVRGNMAAWEAPCKDPRYDIGAQIKKLSQETVKAYAWPPEFRGKVTGVERDISLNGGGETRLVAHDDDGRKVCATLTLSAGAGVRIGDTLRVSGSSVSVQSGEGPTMEVPTKSSPGEEPPVFGHSPLRALYPEWKKANEAAKAVEKLEAFTMPAPVDVADDGALVLGRSITEGDEDLIVSGAGIHRMDKGDGQVFRVGDMVGIGADGKAINLSRPKEISPTREEWTRANEVAVDDATRALAAQMNELALAMQAKGQTILEAKHEVFPEICAWAVPVPVLIDGKPVECVAPPGSMITMGHNEVNNFAMMQAENAMDSIMARVRDAARQHIARLARWPWCPVCFRNVGLVWIGGVAHWQCEECSRDEITIKHE